MTNEEIEILQQKARSLICNDIGKLAPKMQVKVNTALSILGVSNIDAMVYETIRSDELEGIYYLLGTTKAKSALYSWHGYGLAVDIISRAKQWDVWPVRNADGSLSGGDESWYNSVIAAFKAQGLEWGGDWNSIFDAPHFQFSGIKSSPSDQARVLYSTGGYEAVWKAVGAL